MLRVNLIPLNGLVNKLRSITSTLALFPDREIYCYWNEEYLLSGGRPIVSHERISYLNLSEYQDLTSSISLDSEGLSRQGNILYLWHPQGEQAFIPDFMRRSQDSSLGEIVIRSGGEFGAGSKRNRLQSRRAIYKELKWEPDVVHGFEQLRLEEPYLGLHLRGRDLEHLAPSPRVVQRKLASLSGRLNVRQVFVAADTSATSELWRKILAKKGFDVRYQASPEFDMSTSHGVTEAGFKGAIAAGVDFLTLSNSIAMVYGHTSSFGHEASVQTSYPSLCAGLYPQKGKFRYALNVARREAGIGSLFRV